MMLEAHDQYGAVNWLTCSLRCKEFRYSLPKAVSMSVQERDVASLPELVGTALEIKATLGEGSLMWFRGQHCHEYALLPKLMREHRSVAEIFDRERRLLTRFQQRSLPYWPEGYPQNDWEHLFALQHYGGATRLLDWSENLFVATYFALSSNAIGHAEHDGCIPTIYCIDPVRWNRSMPSLSGYGDAVSVLTTADVDFVEAYRPFTIKRRTRDPVAIFGTHNSKRIVAQRGTFVVWGNQSISLEEIANEQAPHILWKIRLRGSREQLYGDLHSLGFGETMIFPELSFLATELDRTEGWR